MTNQPRTTEAELRSLDALIAEKVMAEWVAEQEVGKHVPPNSVIIHINGRSYWHPVRSPHMKGWSGLWPLPRYSQDIAAAFTVVEKMRESGKWCCIDIHSDFNYIWRVTLTRAEPYNEAHTATASAQSETSLPEAICRAALSAIKAGTGD